MSETKMQPDGFRCYQSWARRIFTCLLLEPGTTQLVGWSEYLALCFQQRNRLRQAGGCATLHDRVWGNVLEGFMCMRALPKNDTFAEIVAGQALSSLQRS